MLADGTAGVFTYDTTTGASHQVAVPGTTSITDASINNRGDIAGTAIAAGGAEQAFAIVGGKAQLLTPPGAASSSASSVATDGTVVGIFTPAESTLTSGFVVSIRRGPRLEQPRHPAVAALW